MANKFWAGNPPKICDLCAAPLLARFIDGKTQRGPWGNMCFLCYVEHGCGLGTGRGQQYDLQKDGRWKKTGG